MRAPNRAVILALVAALIALATAGAWAAVTGVVSGTVTDQDTGQALSGANVSLVDTELSTVTNARGRFVITNVPPGASGCGNVPLTWT